MNTQNTNERTAPSKQTSAGGKAQQPRYLRWIELANLTDRELAAHHHMWTTYLLAIDLKTDAGREAFRAREAELKKLEQYLALRFLDRVAQGRL
jgi:hypothetical protein